MHTDRYESKRIKDFPSAEHLQNFREMKNLLDDDIQIIASTDHEFAISDKVGKYLRETKESLLICCPYVSKSFIDKIRILPKGSTIEFLTLQPSEKDFRNIQWTVRAIESLRHIANENAYKLSIMCDPYKHGKFIVFDKSRVISGSFNHTSSSMYYKHEILNVWKNPTHVKRFIEIFYEWWNSPNNTAWENVQLYYGYKRQGDHYSIQKRIAAAIIGFFHSNGNRETKILDLIEKGVRRGFKKEDVIEVIKNLRRGNPAILYEPNRDTLKLVHYQTDIDDF